MAPLTELVTTPLRSLQPPLTALHSFLLPRGKPNPPSPCTFSSPAPSTRAGCLFSLLPPPGRPNPASAPPSSRTPPPPRIAANPPPPPATPLPPPAPLTGLRPPTSTPSTPTTARARLHSFLLPGGKPKTRCPPAHLCYTHNRPSLRLPTHSSTQPPLALAPTSLTESSAP